MSSCIICFLCRFHRLQYIYPGQQHPIPYDLTTELEDSRKFSLNLLMALLSISAISGSKALQPVALTLLIYTINLRLALNACFLQNYPTMSRFLHVIPLLGTSCMAGIELVLGVQSIALAILGILLGILPLVTMAVHHARHCIEAPVTELPVHAPAPAVSGAADTTPASG
ncbi:hypothetical protein HD554DRAFT_1073451 [Boletus coccyginus]|nr:hypothetical protein HD554DRAFT_1073451 [Boletus coccyginus]